MDEQTEMYDRLKAWEEADKTWDTMTKDQQNRHLQEISFINKTLDGLNPTLLGSETTPTSTPTPTTHHTFLYTSITPQQAGDYARYLGCSVSELGSFTAQTLLGQIIRKKIGNQHVGWSL